MNQPHFMPLMQFRPGLRQARLWLCAAVLSICAPVGQAQTPPASNAAAAPAPDPAPLAAARAAFLRQALTDSQTLTEQYERALAKIEQELAEAADYEEARLVQQRRTELKALYASGDPVLAQSLSTPLLPSQARFIGSTEMRGDQITGWRTGNSAVEWSNVRLNPGKYYLEIEANFIELPSLPGVLVPGRSQPTETASFEFFEVSLLPGAAENRRSFEIQLSPDDTTFETQKIGPVTFTRSPITLRLVTPAGYPGNLLRVRNLRLIPATEAVPTVTTPEVDGPSLDELKKSLNADLTAAQKPLLDAYLESLRTLARTTPALRDAVSAETRRMVKLMETTRGQATGPLRLLGGSGGLGGYEDLDGALFANDPANTGDSFLVLHEERKIRVRLLWVQCAPLNAADAGAARQFGRHFDIAPETDLAPLARTAQEFTAGYLEGKALRILLRPGENKDGSRDALVFLPETGLFQYVLVDQGLAAVVPPRERRGMMENGLFEALQIRETAARRQKPAPGAWGLSESATR